MISVRIIIESCVVFGIVLCLLINFTYKNSHIVSLNIVNHHHYDDNSKHNVHGTTSIVPTNYHLVRFLRKRLNTTITKLQSFHPLKQQQQQQQRQNQMKSNQQQHKQQTFATAVQEQTIHRKLKVRNDDDDDDNDVDTDIDTDVDTDDNENEDSNNICPCGNTIQNIRPDVTNKVGTARWMVHTLDWGVLSTISTRIINTTTSFSETTTNNDNETMPIQEEVPIIPFGNVYSLIDGSCDNSTGIPYMYGSYLDQSFKDIIFNSYVSLTLSEATIRTTCIVSSYNDPFITNACVVTQQSSTTKTKGNKAVRIDTKSKTSKKKQQQQDSTIFPGDPESPLCARLTITGKLIEVPNPNQKSNMYNHQQEQQENDNDNDNNTNNDNEYNFVLQSLYERHPQMKYWPTDHHWTIMKLNIIDLWLIDYFGGATIIHPTEYFQYTV